MEKIPEKEKYADASGQLDEKDRLILKLLAAKRQNYGKGNSCTGTPEYHTGS